LQKDVQGNDRVADVLDVGVDEGDDDQLTTVIEEHQAEGT